MHHIYKTKAIILSSSSIKESDKQLNVLTEDLGLMKVIAQGTRKMESKLRPSIQDFSVSNIAVVSGRTGWRLVNASIIYSISDKLENYNLLQSIARTFGLVERLVGSESDDNIFKTISNSVEFIISNQNKILHTYQIKCLESILVANLLKELGYLDDFSVSKVISEPISLDLIESVQNLDLQELNKVINQSIRDSGL